ncbi:MAG: ribokinase [Alphaproteobacteria bacterium]|nr:ribokinase [Alphaproteobacteria bacterium]
MIIVFGSNVLDLFFQQENLPPKDTALFLDNHVEAPGGKGANQAIAAARAGSEVRFYGALGDGGHGRQMYKNLAHNKVDVSGIEFLDMPSGLATIFVDEKDGTHRIVVSQGANLKARQSSVPDKHLNGDTIVLVQGELPIAETEKLIIRAKSKGAKTVMNFAPAIQKLSEDLLNALDIIVLNEYEADSLGKQYDIVHEDKEELAKLIQKRFNLTTVVTLGPKGSVTALEENILKVPALGIKPIDTVGAGDAFTGCLCAALDQNKPLEEALHLASIAGSLACTKIGAQEALPTLEEIQQVKEHGLAA